MMDNFQLYKTSPLLGGQMKIDMVIEDRGGKLYVDDFHLTPISPNIPYNKYSKDVLANYTHQSNMRDFYKEIESYFYEDCVDPELLHEWPLSTKRKNYDDTFFAGCKRAQYNIYNKQFEFLVPLWLENVNKSIEFIINVYGPQKTLISSKTISISKDGEGKFDRYMYDYFKYIGIDSGSDEVMKIDLRNNHAYIHGVNMISGDIDTKDVSEIVDNILFRERPLLEFDSMLINQFSNNHMITKQLFNFCLCINPDDLINSELSRQMIGSDLKIGVDVKVDGNILDKKDIYTNFEYIEKDVYNNYWKYDGLKEPEFKKETSNINVLDYLHDDMYIDHIYSNKIVQKIPHWQIVDNPGYIFNVYDGFAGVYKENNTIKEGSHTNGITPNTEIKEYKDELNNIGWANVVTDLTTDAFIRLSTGFENDSIFTKAGKWMKGLKYNIQKDQEKDLYILLAVCADVDKYDKLKTNGSPNLKYSTRWDNIGNYVILYGRSKNDITFAYIRSWLNDLGDDLNNDIVLSQLKELINSYTQPSVISFDKSIMALRTQSPSILSDEIEYYKDNNSNNYVLRYDGNIKPCFISDHKNYIYCKKCYGDNNMRYNSDMNGSGYTPKFPSINFYSLNKEYISYDKINDMLYVDMEYKWFNSSSFIFLESYIKFEITCEENNIDDNVNRYLNDIYRLNNGSKLDYIKSKYNIFYNLVEAKNDNNNTYIIEMKLK